jgi:signal transduction histidine kinase
VVGAIQVWGCVLAASRPWSSGAPLDGLGYALLLAGPVALVVRRIAPLTTLTVAVLAADAYLLLDYARGPYLLAAFVALVSAAQRSRRAAVWTVAAVCALPVVGGAIYGTTSGYFSVSGHTFTGISTGSAVTFAVVLVLALAIGEVSRSRRERWAEIRRSSAATYRARQEQTRRQASDERLRIAGELHDVLGHHLSLINVRAGVALHLLDTQPQEARDALHAIKVASAEALREVRALLGTLSPWQAPRNPAPGLAAVDHLVAEAQEVGMAVQLVRRGELGTLPGEVERAAFRIVQESLTNVRRHAGPGALVTVTLDATVEALQVRVEDTGSGPVPSQDGEAVTTGNGIAGMRERATALGGSLTAGPGPGGTGFVIEVRLPRPAPAPTQECA